MIFYKINILKTHLDLIKGTDFDISDISLGVFIKPLFTRYYKFNLYLS